MSLNILLIGAEEALSSMRFALESGLHEVTCLSARQGLNIHTALKYNTVILCLDSLKPQSVKTFVSLVKAHKDLQHLPIIAYGTNAINNVPEAIISLPFDDYFHPQSEIEYSYFATKVTGVYRRVQLLRSMQNHNDLMDIEKSSNNMSQHHIAVLVSSENMRPIQIAQAEIGHLYALEHIQFFGMVKDLEVHLHKQNCDIIIVDGSLGLDALKLASKLSSGSDKIYPVLILIPENAPQLAMQSMNIRSHHYINLPIIPRLFNLKISAMRRWATRYQLLNDTVDKQLSMSVRDELTQLYNRHYLNKLLDKMLDQVAKQKQKFSLCLIDVDHFKDFNDSYGHNVGDAILSQLAHLMQLQVRRNDNVGRWGGEEFIIIFADVTEKIGIILAERIRKTVEAHDFTIPKEDKILKITISIGIAHCAEEEKLDRLIARADFAMYEAKTLGRNRVESK